MTIPVAATRIDPHFFDMTTARVCRRSWRNHGVPSCFAAERS